MTLFTAPPIIDFSGGVLVAGGSFFSDGTPPTAPLFGWGGRMFLGESSTHNGATDGNVIGGSWLQTQGAGSEKMDYLEDLAGFASTSKFGIGATGASRTLSGAGVDSLGIVGFAVADLNDTGANATGGYFEAVKQVSGTGFVAGLESNATVIVKDTSWDGLTPFIAFQNGMTLGMSSVSGGDVNVNPTTFPADAAYRIGNNGNTFLSGIVFRHNALEAWADGRQRAILLPRLAMISWWDNAENEMFNIDVTSSLTANKQSMVVNDAGVTFKDDAGATVLFIDKTNHTINATSFPTSAAGLPTGSMWNNAGVPNIV